MTEAAERVWCGLDERAAVGLVNEALTLPPELIYDSIVRRCRMGGHR